MIQYVCKLLSLTFFLITGICGQTATGGIAETIKVSKGEKLSLLWRTLVLRRMDFYKGCNEDKICFGSPDNKKPNCINQNNCNYAVRVKKLDPETLTYLIDVLCDISKMSKAKAQYLGVGFGRSAQMTNLAVLECVKDSNNKGMGYTSYVGDQHSPPIRTKANPEVNLTDAGIDGNQMVCTFQVPNIFKLPGIGEVDLINKKYHLMLAWGLLSTGDSLLKHDNFLTSEEINFNSTPFQVKSEDPTQSLSHKTHQLHGVLMTIVYMGLMPIGTIIARFFRETWTTIKLFNKRLWFIIHATLMCLALLLGLIAYFIIPLQTGQWWPSEFSESSQNHAILGVTSLVLLMCQSIGPWFIPQSKLFLKKVYFTTHAYMGLLCYVLGIANIALASSWVPSVQTCEGVFVTSIWIGVHCSIYILLTTLLYVKDFELEEPSKNCRAFTAFPMTIQIMEDAPGAAWRKAFLVCFVILSIITCISMSVLIYVHVPCRK